MKSVTQLNGLRDLRTAVSGHMRSAPRRAGSTYLEAYLLEMERRRLEAELAWMAKRQDGITSRLRTVRENVRQVLGQRPNQRARARSVDRVTSKGSRKGSRPAKWRTVPLEY